LTFRVAGLDEIKQWIMGFGFEAYVIEPEKLRNMIKADLKKAFIQYEQTKPAYQELDLPKSSVDFVYDQLRKQNDRTCSCGSNIK